MPKKTIIFIGMTLGSLVGGYIPALWGSSLFSLSSIIFSGVGGLLGIYVGYQLADYLGF